MVFDVWFCPSALMSKTMDKLGHFLRRMGLNYHYLTPSLFDIRFLMNVYGNVYDERSRIWCLVLSVIRVQDAFQAPVKVCIAFMSRNQTTTNSWREITASLLMMGHYCVNLNTLTLNTTLMVTTEASSGSNKQDLESSGKLAASRLWRSSKFESSNAGNFHSEGLNLQIPLVSLDWLQNLKLTLCFFS